MSKKSKTTSSANSSTAAMKTQSRGGHVSPQAAKNQKTAHEKVDDLSEDGSLDIGACTMCHCSLDFSDRAAFFKDDREEDYEKEEENNDDEDSFYFRAKDPYLPEELYDPNNALVYCDSCDRMFHQKCHFVPVLVLPRGDWVCMYCQSKTAIHGNGKKKNKQTKRSDVALSPEAPEKDTMFRSPPDLSVIAKEKQWEFQNASKKASMLRTELKRLQSTCQGQLSNARQAEMALDTLMSTTKNRNHFFKSSSQELAQCLVKLFGAQYKLRQFVQNLEDIRLSDDTRWNLLVNWSKQQSADFVQRVLFPFGLHHARRLPKRTPEMALYAIEQQKTTVPSEIVVSNSKQGAKKQQHASKQHPHKKAHSKKGKVEKEDDGISLDDLECCVCHHSEATDENDLILCDGARCFRAYHMKCVKPELSMADLEDETEDWFCPLCQGLADLMMYIQANYLGDEWEQQRLAKQIDGKATTGSLKSWDDVADIFPDAEWQYNAACQLRDGQRNNATDKLLTRVLGPDGLPEFDEEDNVEDDGHFDLDSYAEERRLQKENESDDDSTASSQATLQEMSSVELEIPDDELAALSGDEVSEGGDDDSSDESMRRSRRLRKIMENIGQEGQDPGELDESNIIDKKRGRKPVDYIKLNEALFGDLPAVEASKLDDTEEFEAKTRPSPSNDHEVVSDLEDGEEGSEDGDEGGAESDDSCSVHSDKDSASEMEDDDEQTPPVKSTKRNVNKKRSRDSGNHSGKTNAKNGVKNGDKRCKGNTENGEAKESVREMSTRRRRNKYHDSQ